ncbi:UPF0701 protein YicC [Candidatus Westeberhardia cardiocondylae]|uniref:UPF0701 protein YicC n=1 Tax=Candidatus Westeberhardia cardiocondylae TaxID=1594731 RepID=A0A0H5BWM6_9ENTR|nr:YicC/YloC family endoribonuclease [Candidatus Westeberhardia cardiocondylae]CEN32068.1 UPF0701 protein YicC [Candidatus Westeberhardia cardiocondylae]
MIANMNAFLTHKIQNQSWKASWKICSTSQRFLEIQINLPQKFYHLKTKIYKQIYSKISRGKIECNLFFEKIQNQQKKNQLYLNKNLAKQLIKSIRWIKQKNKEGYTDILSILKWPGIITKKNFNPIDAKKLLSSFEEAINNFIKKKIIEGEIIKKEITTLLNKMINKIQKIRTELPFVIMSNKQDILKKINNTEINTNSITPEEETITTFLHNIDITKELDRLEIHINKIQQNLRKDTNVGKYLNFILQECERELHRILKKNTNIYIINSSIELKMFIEKILEHTQNIE